MEKIQQIENSLPHLRSDVKPIMACLDDQKPDDLKKVFSDSEHGFDFLNMDMNPEQKDEDFIAEFKEDLWAYIISPVDNKDKFSLKYAECTGLAVVGIDKETGENISFLSHQNPGFFLLYDDDNFIRDLKKQMETIMERCEPKTVDAVMFGGKFSDVRGFEEGHHIHKYMKDEYIKSIKLISESIKSVVGFSPTVISGPKFNPAYDHAVFKNKNRQLFLYRFSDNPDFINNFNPEDIDALSKKWKPGQWSLPKK